MYKPKGYDASRDAPEVKEPRALPEAPMYKPVCYDASRDAPEVNEPRALYSSEASLCHPAPRNTSALSCSRRSPSTLGLNSHQLLFDPHAHSEHSVTARDFYQRGAPDGVSSYLVEKGSIEKGSGPIIPLLSVVPLVSIQLTCPQVPLSLAETF